MIRVSFANQKGGVGKTTVTLGFAEAAFLSSKRVLVVDCDPQSNATSGLGISTSAESKTLVDVLKDEIELNNENINDYVYKSTWNDILLDELEPISQNHTGTVPTIDVLPANGHLSSIEPILANDPIGACDRLENALVGISHLYDFVFFDCPPSLGLLTINALYASDQVVIVSGPSAWSSDGVTTFTSNISRIAKRLNGRPILSAIVINNVGRTRDAKFWQSEIIENNVDNNEIKTQSISSRAAIAEAGAMSVPISALGKREGVQVAKEEFSEAFKCIFHENQIKNVDSLKEDSDLINS